MIAGDTATGGSITSQAGSNRKQARLQAPPVPDAPNSEERTLDPFKSLYGHCVGLRRHGSLERSFAADGDGFRAACAAVYSPNLSAPEDFNIEEFRRWNTPCARLWHSPNPPCLCKKDPQQLCEVCYQISSGLKRPWYLEHPPGQGDMTLCQDCRHLNFSFILNFGHKASGNRRMIPLGRLSGLMLRQGNCAFCRLVSSLVAQNGQSSVTPGSSIPEVYSLLSARPGFLRVEFVSFSDYGWEDHRRNNILGNAPYRGASMPLVPSLSIHLVSALGIREWFRESWEPNIRISLIKTWIESSDLAFRKSTSRPRAKMLGNLRLIDVIKECITEVEVIRRYMILSYVWGGPQQLQMTKANKRDLEQEGGLRAELVPLTIRDAIYLTRQLGERYLWVDSLCIVQDDADSKHTEISRMDQIYENAYCTIVAAHGTTVNDGLPGLHPDTRIWTQSKETIQGYHLASLYRRPTLPRPRATWGSRGWTYQEQLLSQRLLMFESTYISFHDFYGSYHEDHHGRVYLPRTPIMMSTLSGANIEIYSKIVEEYTKRTLSFPEDIFNAFLGISSKLASKFRGPFVYGLPSTEIDIALLWRPAQRTAPFSRRLVSGTDDMCNPSWSWAGWEGAVTYSNILRTEHASKIAWIDHRNESRFSTSDLRGTVEGAKSRWATEMNEFRVPVYYEKSAPSELYLHPVSKQWMAQQHTLVASPSTHLHFEAYSVSLFLAPQSTSYADGLPDDGARLKDLLVFTADGFVSGMIYASDETPPPQPVQREFIVLSQTRLELQTSDTPASPEAGKSAGRSMDGDLHQKLVDVRAYIESKVKEAQSHQPSKRRESRRAAATRPLSNSIGGMKNMQDLSDRINANYSDALASPASDWDSYLPRDIPFDRTVFDEYRKWCLYNIMMIEWRNGVAYRAGIGVCHIDVVEKSSMQLKRVVLG